MQQGLYAVQRPAIGLRTKQFVSRFREDEGLATAIFMPKRELQFW